MDPRNGYNPATKTYHQVDPPFALPPPSAPLTAASYILSLLTSSPAFSPTSAALVDAPSSLSLSYSTLLRRVRCLSAALSGLHFPPGRRRVALVLCPPSLHVPPLYLSLLSLNVVVSPANPLSTDPELDHLVSLSSPSVIFSVSDLSPRLRRFGLPLVLLDSPDFLSMLNHPGGRGKAGMAADTGGSVSQGDTAVIMYSSGTTGRVKGVELTHRNVIAYVASAKHSRDEHERENGASPRGTSLIPLPLFHVFGFAMLLRGVAMGDTLVLLGRFDFEGMLGAVEEHRVTFVPVSPPLIVAMVRSELTDRYDLRSLELVGCGGAPLGKDAADKFKAKFPNIEIIQGYGMTETAGAGARLSGSEGPEKHGSVGRLLDLLEAKIVDPSTGEALPPGQRGELWLRGPTVMKGYVGDEEATAATFTPDGWMKTGDLCYFDSDGFLYIVDRLKELIKYKGYQVPPAELEQLLLSHPEVADAAVVPYPDEEAGQIPMAFVVRKPGSNANASEVMDFVAKQVSPYKKIRRVSFVSSIPKNPSGKILRRELVNQAISTSSKL